MERKINGRRYNTETAKRLATFEAPINPADMDYYTETLCRNKFGAYFLHGQGGARTRYAKRIGKDNWASGENVVPLTEDEAKKWAEESCDTATYDRIFRGGEPSPAPVMAYLPPDLLAKVDASKETHGSRNAVVIAALRAYLE